MEVKNSVTELLGIKYPVIQGGMVWASGWKLASAVSNCGGLGLIGSGSMKPELLREHIQKCRNATNKPFGVNIPLLRGDADQLVKVVIEEGIEIVFSAAGHPGKFIEQFKNNGIKVVHVVSSVKFAQKAQSVGCDAVVGEGVEAGGHNGADQITTMCLIPQLAEALSIPVIAAGGIATGQQVLAALTLGAGGVQIGTAFAATPESSMHENYKKAVIESAENGTTLVFQKLGLTRAIKNSFTNLVREAELAGADEERLKTLLGTKKEMLGMFEGDIEQGLVEAGQSAALVKNNLTVEQFFSKLIQEFSEAKNRLNRNDLI